MTVGATQVTRAEADESGVVLEARSVSKTFGATRALRDVTVRIRRGEIHAIIGHNGAGKSTLVKILSGVHQPEAGSVLVDGRPVTLGSPVDASDEGIALVFQEFSLIPDLTVAQNVFLRTHGAPLFGFIDDAELRRKTAKILARLGSEIDPSRPVRRLGVADRQLVEIAKALSYERRVLMLDEPTAALSAAEVDRLFIVLRALAESGIAIAFISHHLREVLRICDVVTVLRDGAVVLDEPVREHSIESLVSALIGATTVGEPVETTSSPPGAGEVVLTVDALASAPHVRDVSLELRRGEVLGVAGLLGSGAGELLEVLFGSRHITGGTVRYGSHQRAPGSAAEAIAQGAFLVPEDRRVQGLVLDHTTAQNIVMAMIGRLTRAGFVDERAVTRMAEGHAEMLQIRGRLHAPARDLSGGNQQKVVIAKALATGAHILLLSEPTIGIDISTAREIVNLVRRFVAAGNAAIWVSSDFEELTRVADRVLIMHQGSVVGERLVQGDTRLTEEELLHAVQ